MADKTCPLLKLPCPGEGPDTRDDCSFCVTVGTYKSCAIVGHYTFTADWIYDTMTELIPDQSRRLQHGKRPWNKEE